MRLFIAILAATPFAFGQNLPTLRWAVQPDGSAAYTLVNVGSDSAGNIYLAGSTPSPALPVKGAIQNALASAGLYRIDGPGAAYIHLATNIIISALAADPKNPAVFYAVSSGSGFKSIDGGNTWTALQVPTQTLMQLVVDPVNDQNVYGTSYYTGFLKSSDGGATWNVIDNGLPPFPIPAGMFDYDDAIVGIDPNSSAVFVQYGGSLIARSTDGGASWQPIPVSGLNVSFDTHHPGTIYVTGGVNGAYKSVDGGETFQPVSIPVTAIFADPAQPGRLLGNGAGNLFESDDDGASWTLRLPLTIVAADWDNGILYGFASGSIPGFGPPILPGVLEISSDLKTVTPIGPPILSARGLVVSNRHAYVPMGGGANIFVTKLDPNGNVVYSTYFGGSGDDQARAMAVDSAGDVFIAGGTSSTDFPTTKGSYAPAFASVADGYSLSPSGLLTPLTSFLFKLNPDGSLAYSTYFPVAYNAIGAMAVDGTGSVYLTGSTEGGLPTTPGAYQSACACGTASSATSEPFETDAFLTKFDPTGATLVYSTYLGVGNADGRDLALGSDGSAYIASAFPGSGVQAATSVYRINSSGSSLLETSAPNINITAMALGPDGNLYMAGAPVANAFQPTAGAFQAAGPAPALPTQGGSARAIVKMDSQLQNILAATYFGGPYNLQINAMAVDAEGNVDIGGTTFPRGLPTRTLIFPGFSAGPAEGFLSQLSGDLSTLLFSTYLGDQSGFQVLGVTAEAGGNVVIGGLTYQNSPTVWVNSLSVVAPPALRIDAIDNAASMLDGPIAAGETILVKGAGFGSDAQLSIGGQAVPALSVSPTQIVAVAPSSLTATAVTVQVQSGGAISNVVPVPVANTAPGIFSADGSGTGEGYILNQDRTQNSSSNPAHPGDQITIFATGVGPVSFSDGYAVTASPVNVFISNIYCDGVAAILGPVAGFPGSVYEITVLVPKVSATSPQALIMQVGGQISQNGVAIYVAQ